MTVTDAGYVAVNHLCEYVQLCLELAQAQAPCDCLISHMEALSRTVPTTVHLFVEHHGTAYDDSHVFATCVLQKPH